MGILDDAIRAHLELKREHGASAEELERQEREALGPARRDLGEDEIAQGTDDQADAAEAEPALAGDEREAEPEPAAPVTEPSPPAHAEPEPAALEPEPEPEPDPRSGDTPPRGSPAIDERDEPAPAEQEGEDVLEETPEFLQETPEHDRLWFEQKPPRDFDFDDE